MTKKDKCDVPYKGGKKVDLKLNTIYAHLPDTRHSLRLYKAHDLNTGAGIYHLIMIPNRGIGKKELTNIDKNLASKYEVACDSCNNTPHENPTYVEYHFNWKVDE